MKPNKLYKFIVTMILISIVALIGCEGDQGPAGPAGDDGSSISEYTYVGDKGEACSHCHASTVEQVALTGHSQAYDIDPEDLENPYCVQCHTTGWDRPVSYGSDDWMTATNPDVNGFDDYFGVEGDEAAERRAALEGVQCESCHGPMGPDFNNHRPDLNFATMGTHDPENIVADDIISDCYPCHKTQFEGPSGDFTGGYATSAHASVAGGDVDAFNQEHYAHIGSCQGCHTSEGFIAANDPAFTDYNFSDNVNFIGCVTCHDPHMGDGGEGNPAQLRTVGNVVLSYTFPYEPDDPEAPTMSGYGSGQLCANCHKGRRDNANVAGQIANGYAYFGPHHSSQTDMYIGYGSYEIEGQTYDRSHTHQNAEHACVNCHMVRETELHGSVQEVAFHNFRPEIGTNCTGCHEEGFSDTDVDAFQGTIEDLMDSLATRFGYVDYHDMEENWDSTDEAVTVWEREAAYAMFFIIGDGSLGVHNPDYATDLLNAAISHYDDND